jgi:ketosteroid isomerase-like protein
MPDEAVELTRRFIDAFNGRDIEAIREMVGSDAELVDAEGNKLKGFDAAGELLAVAANLNVRLGRTGEEQVEEDEDEIRVTAPVRITGAAEDERHGTAVFAIRDERVSEFRVEQDD